MPSSPSVTRPDPHGLAAQFVVRKHRPAKSQALKNKVLDQLFRTLALDVGRDRAHQLIDEAEKAFELLTPPPEDQSTIQGMKATFTIIDDVLNDIK